MKLTLDCIISPRYVDFSAHGALALLLSKGGKTWSYQPLEEYVCHTLGVNPQSDYPLAALAASADGLVVGSDYWLRADPAHLQMQRDSFSLAEPTPVPMDASELQFLVSSLNAHFQQDLNMKFEQGRSGACYLRLLQDPQIKTSVPSAAIGKNIFQFMPQGEASAQWRAYLNEIQMLLHTHPLNVQRESAGLPVINSIWLSGGGVMPQAGSGAQGSICIVASQPLHRGLAQYIGVACQNMPASMKDLLSNNICTHMHVACPTELMFDDHCFQVLVDALKAGQVNQLVMNLGYYERTLVVTVTRLDLFKFWRKSLVLSDVLN